MKYTAVHLAFYLFSLTRRRRATRRNLESTLGSRTRGFKVPSLEIALHKFTRCECWELLARFIKLWHSKSRSTWLAVGLTWFSIHDNPNYTRHLCGFAGKNMSKAQLGSFLSINSRARYALCIFHNMLHQASEINWIFPRTLFSIRMDFKKNKLQCCSSMQNFFCAVVFHLI